MMRLTIVDMELRMHANPKDEETLRPEDICLKTPTGKRGIDL